MILALSLSAECAILDIDVRDTVGKPAANVMFQIFQGNISVDDNAKPLEIGGRRSDGNGFPGYATDSEGKLQLELDDGFYTLVGFSKEQHLILVKKTDVPDSITIKAANTVPVSISCQAADGSPIQAAEIFFRPTKQSRASVGVTGDSGLLNAHVSAAEYHVIMQSQFGAGPRYLTLPYETISSRNAEINFHVAELPTGELYVTLPKAATQVSTLEVLESTYTNEHTRSIETDFNYDTHYTDFYSLINPNNPYTLSSDIDYNFSISFVAMFGIFTLYAYEFWPPPYAIGTGTHHINIADEIDFALHTTTDRGNNDPVYNPGDKVTLHYEFWDTNGTLLHRILGYTNSRLVLPIVTVWDPNGVPIASNFNTENFFEFKFILPTSAAIGKYRATISLDTGMYGKTGGEFHFYVYPSADQEPPQIKSLDIPEEHEAGEGLIVTAKISDDIGLIDAPKLSFSIDSDTSWTEFTMLLTNEDTYQATIPAMNSGELNWRVMAEDTGGSSAERSGIINVLDTLPPIVNHEQPEAAELGHELWIQTDVQDNGTLENVTLFYLDTDDNLISVEMWQTDGLYLASIPGSEIISDRAQYYIQAVDSEGNTAYMPEKNDAPKFASIPVSDTHSPIISHIPVGSSMANIPIRIEAIITDNGEIAEATLFYGDEGSQDYQSINMSNSYDTYFAEIPAEFITTNGIKYHITASDGSMQRTSSPETGDHFIEIRPEPDGVLARLEISPSADQSAPLDFIAGESAKFMVTGYSVTNNPLPADVIWSSTGGIGHIDQNGLLLATGRISGNGVGKIIATARHTVNDEILQTEAWIRISPGQPQNIMLNPKSAILEAGDSIRFYAAVTDKYSNPVSAAINWNVDSDRQIGTMNNGLFSATKADSGDIIAEIDGIRAIGKVVITPGPLKGIIVSPAMSQIGEIEAGKSVQFSAEGYDVFGNRVAVAPVWSVRGGVGTIRGDGLFTGGKARTGHVVATIGDLSSEIKVDVIHGELYSVSVSPYVAYLPLSSLSHSFTQQYVADGRDIAGNQVPLANVNWTTDAAAGSITKESGLFTSTNSGVYVGNIVTNGTIFAKAKSLTGRKVTGLSYVVIQRIPADRLSSIDIFVQRTSGDTGDIPIATGESIQFEIVGTDDKGIRLSLNPSWSVEGGIGHIDVNGLFTATKPGFGAIVATAGGFTGRAQIQTTPGILKSIVIRPDILVTSPGKQHPLTAEGYDSFENVLSLDNYDIRWSVTGSAVDISYNKETCIIDAVAQGSSIISVNVGDVIGFTNIFVSSASIDGNISHAIQQDTHGDFPYYLKIEPEFITLHTDEHQAFTAYAVDVSGRIRDSDIVSWSVLGGIGDIDPSGLFKSGDKAGSGHIIITDDQTFGAATVVISDSMENAQELVIMPSEVSIYSGATQDFVAFEKTSDGELIPTLPAWRVIGNIGKIDASGQFIATTAGTGEIEATVRGLSAKLQVTVLPGFPVQVSIQPASLSMQSGDQEKFGITGRDNAGNLVDFLPEFQIVGDLGTTDNNGQFAARRAKAGNVLAANASENLVAAADVTVSPGKLAALEVVQESQRVLAGNSVRFSAIGKDLYGNFIPLNPTWEIEGPIDIGSISSNGLFIANKTGKGEIYARAGELTDSVLIEVYPDAPALIHIEPALVLASSQEINTRQFSATFLDLRGNIAETADIVELSWSVTQGLGSINPQTGTYTNEINLDSARTGDITAIAIIGKDTGQERTIRGRATVILSPTVKPLVGITVTPDSVQVIKGDTHKFTAVGIDSDGVQMSIYPTWSVISNDSGSGIPNTISADGIFNTTSEMEIGSSWRVVASVETDEGQIIRGEARLTIETGPLQSIEVTCKDDSCIESIESGQQVEVEAIGYDQFGNSVSISPTWKITGEIGVISSTSNSNASITAGLAGSGEIIAEAEAKEGKVHITVIPGQLASIQISTDPASNGNIGMDQANPLIVKADSEMRFVAVGYDSGIDVNGNPKPTNQIDISPAWSAIPSDASVDIGSISADGRFVGKEIGGGQIVAEADSVTGSFFIAIVAGDLVSIRVSPSPVSVVSGTEEQFSASGYDLYGNEIPELQTIWETTGNIGNIDENGLFTPISLQVGDTSASGTIVASTADIQGASSVTIVSALGKFSEIYVSIEPSIVPAGGKAICTIRGADEYGNPIADISSYGSLSVSVSSQLGTMEPSDNSNEWTFRADRNLSLNLDERAGLITVRLRIDDEIFYAETPIELVPGTLNKITVEPSEFTLSAGSAATFEAAGFDTWGNERELTGTEWTVSKDIGNVTVNDAQEAIFTAITAGQGQLIAGSQGYEGRTELTVIPGKLQTLAIEPAEITIIAGTSHSFVGLGEDRYGNAITDLNLDWQIASDLFIGSITIDGVFTAFMPGNGSLKAIFKDTDDTVYSEEARITVIPGAIVYASISIPKAETILGQTAILLSGKQYNLQIQGTDVLGNPVANIEEVSWNIMEDMGLIEPVPEDASSAVLTTLFPNHGRISATIGDVSTNLDVAVTSHSQKVSSANGATVSGPFDASLEITPSALRTDETISIILDRSPGATEQVKQIGYVYNFKPVGTIFDKPVKLTLSYESTLESEIDDEMLSIYSWNRFQERWIRVGGAVDSYQKSVTATVNYLSLFAIMQENPEIHSEPVDSKLDILDVQLSPNSYFAPEINRLTIHYNLGGIPNQLINIAISIYDIRGRTVRELVEEAPKYAGWNTDQWDGTNDEGETVKNGRYILLITAEADGEKINKVKHLAVFK